MCRICLKNKLNDILRKLVFIIFKPLTVRDNVIVFNNFNGLGFGDNQKNIYEYLYSKKKDSLVYVWLVNHYIDDIPSNVIQIKRNSFHEIFYLSVAKIWVSNCRIYGYTSKKKNQIYFQTWHASYALKKVEQEAKNTLTKEYLYYAMKDAKMCDYILSNSRLQTCDFKKNFWLNQNTNIIELGYPRNDILINCNHEKILEAKANLGLDKNKKYILYAPTFRDNYEYDYNQINFDYIIKYLNDSTNDYWGVIVKLHPNCSSVDFSEDIIDLSNYSNIQDLLCISDLLISDYSTCTLDYSLRGKPIILFIPDLGYYSNDRGLKDEYYKLPFARAYDNSDIIEKIKNINEEYTKYDLSFYGSFDDGLATERVCDFILKQIYCR